MTIRTWALKKDGNTPNIPQEESQLPPTPEEVEAARSRISQARMTLQTMLPFFGYLSMKLKPKPFIPGEQLPFPLETMAVTPNDDMYYNVHYVNSSLMPVLRGDICHECMHPATLCWQRGEGRSSLVQPIIGLTPTGEKILGAPISLWNIAQDLAFNPDIKFMTDQSIEVTLADDAAYDVRFKDMSSEQIYELLLAEAHDPKKGGKAGTVRGDGSGGLNGVLEKHGDMQKDKNGEGSGEGLGVDGSEGLGEGMGSKSLAERAEEWKIHLISAAMVHKDQGQGDLPAGITTLINAHLNPKVDWTTVLSQWIGANGRKSDYTYRRPSRRTLAGIDAHLPSRQRFGVDDVIIAWDTSGSMYGREEEILSEVGGMCEDLGLIVRVILNDAAIHADLPGIQDALDILPIKGGGGSDFRPVFSRLEEERATGIVIAFTDGHISVPPIKPPHLQEVLWVINEGSDVNPTEGRNALTRWGSCLRIHADGSASFE